MAVAKGLLLFLGVKGDLRDLLLYVKYLTIKHFNGLYDKMSKSFTSEYSQEIHLIKSPKYSSATALRALPILNQNCI